jgi:hypothetical protein
MKISKRKDWYESFNLTCEKHFPHLCLPVYPITRNFELLRKMRCSEWNWLCVCLEWESNLSRDSSNWFMCLEGYSISCPHKYIYVLWQLEDKTEHKNATLYVIYFAKMSHTDQKYFAPRQFEQLWPWLLCDGERCLHLDIFVL